MTKRKQAMTATSLPPMARPRAFDDFTPDAKPCPMCVKLARSEQIQPRAVMPLPPYPARLRSSNQPCCRDCQATETAQRMFGVHPDFVAARLTVANERCESLVMPYGFAEHFGMCREGIVRPASIDDLDSHADWLRVNGIEDHA